jgi:hypothetical protein
MSAQIIVLADYLKNEDDGTGDTDYAAANRVLNADPVVTFEQSDLDESERAIAYVLRRINSEWSDAVSLGQLYEALITFSARIRQLRQLRQRKAGPATVYAFGSHHRVAEMATRRARRAYSCRLCGKPGHNRATCQVGS